MLFNKKLTTTLLAALILTSATNAQAMGFNWRKWALFGAVTAVAALVIKKIWATPQSTPAPQVVPAVNNQANALGQELIMANDIQTVQRLIAAGANLNARGPWGATRLILAAERGQTDIVRALIDNGANVNARNILDDTALLYAAQHGHTQIVQALIEAGAHVDIHNRYTYNTALIYAAQRGYTEIVRALIVAGVNVNPQDQTVRATLSIASRHTNRDIFNLLTQEQKRVSTPLHKACSHSIGSENIELMLRDEYKRRAIETMYPDINNLPAGTLTPRIEELLYGENANVDAENLNGHTARQYLQTRAWMMQPIRITIRFLNSDKLTLNCTRGTQIHALKGLIAQHISTPEHTVNTSMITLTRKNNNAEATDYEVAGITTEFHMIIGDTQQHNPGRAQAGPANA